MFFFFLSRLDIFCSYSDIRVFKNGLKIRSFAIVLVEYRNVEAADVFDLKRSRDRQLLIFTSTESGCRQRFFENEKIAVLIGAKRSVVRPTVRRRLDGKSIATFALALKSNSLYWFSRVLQEPCFRRRRAVISILGFGRVRTGFSRCVYFSLINRKFLEKAPSCPFIFYLFPGLSRAQRAMFQLTLYVRPNPQTVTR